MNDFARYRNLVKSNRTGIDLGKVFIVDSSSHTELLNDIIKASALINHFEEYSNWYLPFDCCTCIINCNGTEDQYITLIDNPDHNFKAMRSFKIVTSIGGDFGGRFCIMSIGQETDQFIRSEIAKGTSFVTAVPLSDNILVKYVLVVFIDSVTAIDQYNKVHRGNFMDSFNQVNGSQKASMIDLVKSYVIVSFAHFSNLMRDTKLFVVEEQIATKKKGKVKVKIGSPSIFHVIDLRMIRTKYITKPADPQGGRSLRGPTERRRHKRTFRHDRYTNMKGQTIIIEPYWVGPSKTFDPSTNRLYKIRLDIG